MSKAAQYNGPRLLVPVAMDALVVTKPDSEKWSRRKTGYWNLNNYNSVHQEVTNLTNPAEVPTGIHLQWLLPKYLRQGNNPKEGDPVNFPLVPNHWLIQRMYPTEDNRGLEMSAWVIQSDYKNENDGANEYLSQIDNAYTITKIGRSIKSAKSLGDIKENELFLTAVGGGAPTFSGFTVNNENVFSFIDPMEGLENEEIKVNYVIAGWYSDPTKDFLETSDKFDNQEAYIAWLEELELQVGDKEGLSESIRRYREWCEAYGFETNVDDEGKNAYATQVLCHGSLSSIEWKGVNALIESGKPTLDPFDLANNPDIVVGNTGFDALIAFIRKEYKVDNGITIEKVIELLEDLYCDSMENHKHFNSGFLVERSIHHRWFEGTAGYSYWSIKEEKPLSTLEVTEQYTPKDPAVFQAIKKEQAQLLQQLNNIQTQLDQAIIKLEQLKKECYNLWYKTKKHRNDFLPQLNKEELVSCFHNNLNEISQATSKISGLEGAINSFKEKIDTLITDGASHTTLTQTLHQSTSDNFWLPQSPVVLVSAAKRSDKYLPKGLMSVRYPGETLSAINTQDRQLIIIPYPEEDQYWDIPKALVPKELWFIIREAMLLNPDFGPYLNNVYGQGNQKDLEILLAKQKALSSADEYKELKIDQRAFARMLGFKGVIDSNDYFNKYDPSTSWTPLFLNWKIEYQGTDVSENVSKHWELEGYDYKLKSTSYQPNINLTFEGRTILDDRNTNAITEVIKHFAATQTGNDKNTLVNKDILDELCKFLEDWDILAQRLSGFHEYLTMQDINNVIPIDDNEIRNRLTGVSYSRPVIEKLTQYNAFQPVRKGKFRIKYLNIVDDFGLTFEPTASSYYPLKGRGLETPEQDAFLLLPPRILQPARLNFNWVDAITGQSLNIADEKSTPVCGWIVPNHADNGLFIFDSFGLALGTLLLRKENGEFEAVWNDAPGDNGATPNWNEQILSFVNGIIENRNSGAALQGFIESIDNSLYDFAPITDVEEQKLSLFLGRPLALVRSTLQLELMGNPLVDQSWEKTGNKENYGFLSHVFSARLGEEEYYSNGVIGYFKDGEYKQFNALNPSNTNDYVQKSTLIDLTFEQAAPKKIVFLMEPNQKIQITTGILPTYSKTLSIKYVKEAIEAMDITFRVGSLIANQMDLEKLEISMPKPLDVGGKLSWLYKSGVEIWQETDQVQEATKDAEFADNRYEIHEGWLKLSELFKTKK